jgi:hypothetical protein
MLIRLDTSTNPNFDSLNVLNYLATTHNIKVFHTDEEVVGRVYGRKHIIKYGVDSLLHDQFLMEQFIPKGINSPTKVSVFHEFFESLQAINASKLTIIDPYLFPSRYDTDYPDLLVEIIGYFTSLTEILFVTQSNYNATLYQQVLSRITCTPSIQTNNDFHDRCWIIDDSKGLLVGSSLNGIGKRHSLITKLDDTDVTDILNEL